MKTTESLVADLQRARAGHAEAGLTAEVQRADQQIIAHHTLARLRAERADLLQRDEPAAAAEVGKQIRFWLGHVDEDVDEPTVEEPAAAEAPAAKPKRG